MNPNHRKLLLTLARTVLENKLLVRNTKLETFDLPQFRVKRGVFVSLHKGGDLRGCMGRIDPSRSIFKNVTSLALSAAFEDPRFESLRASELDQVTIEISVLNPSRILEGFDNYEKMNQIRPKIDGVVLKAGGSSATFLPQVWESIPNVEQFVSELCRKAGLKKDYWESQPISLEVYEVEYFSE